MKRRLLWGILACLAAGAFAFPARGAVSYVATGTTGVAGTDTGSAPQNCVPGKPSGIQNNDILILVAASRNNTAHTATGWTLVAQGDVGPDRHMSVWWKRTTGTEGTITVGHNATDPIACWVTAFRGALTTASPIDVSSGIVGPSESGSTADIGSVITTQANTMTWSAIAYNQATTYSSPSTPASSFIRTYQATPGTGVITLATSYGARAAAGATPSQTWQFQDPPVGNSIGLLLALKEDPAPAVPGAPGTPTFSATTSTSTMVAWTAATDATSYKVERAPDAAGVPGAFAQIASGVTTTSYSSSGLSAGTKYWYRVRGTNAAGDGAYSGNGTVTTEAAVSTGYQRYSCSAPSGNCFGVRRNGGRVDFGAGSTDYAYSDGTKVIFQDVQIVGTCTGCGGADTDSVVYQFGNARLPDAINSTADCAASFVDIGTSGQRFGQRWTVKMNGWTSGTIVVRGSRSVGTGTISCRIQNLTDSTTLVAFTNVASSTTCTSVEGTTGSLSLTGLKDLACECKSTVATDDASMANCSLILSK